MGYTGWRALGKDIKATSLDIHQDMINLDDTTLSIEGSRYNISLGSMDEAS
jgi:hypothetical protein